MSSSFSSMQYTIGTALERAREAGHRVEVLVDGHWITGIVAASDGLGLVLDNEGHEHCIVRLEGIKAVRVAAEAPTMAASAAPVRDYESARPMPGPRFAAV
jgi:hypothetical protein